MASTDGDAKVEGWRLVNSLPVEMRPPWRLVNYLPVSMMPSRLSMVHETGGLRTGYWLRGFRIFSIMIA
jgi:hypothetical protein